MINDQFSQEAEMNIKQRCTKCGRELVRGQRTTALLHGPRGFRQYAVCLKCAGVREPSLRTRQKMARADLSVSTPTSSHLEERKMGGEERKDGTDASV